MHNYDALDTAYRHLTTRTAQRRWRTRHPHLGTADQIVATIRNHRPDPGESDRTLRELLNIAGNDPDALTIALYGLAPALRARLGRAVTDDYRIDALTDLAFVLLDGHALDRPRLAHRLVNRAHNRTWQTARRAVTRGTVHPVEIIPTDPNRLPESPWADDLADGVASRVDFGRFRSAVDQAIAAGSIGANGWDAYRRHRLLRAVDPAAPRCDGSQRVTSARTEIRLRPLIEQCLHAA